MYSCHTVAWMLWSYITTYRPLTAISWGWVHSTLSASIEGSKELAEQDPRCNVMSSKAV